ncbi:hypothetical protein FQ087_08870 [Sporosarcina sp. ANT_H38]|uniref:hypothetical protein n=1 Tax=Sporosarcina sp. ANT_H38 TaxID=2597358 RepID=UPI0011F1BAEA|nr:hypothetical protein [Sporosarcina sp. ANT_H38]KAA0966330.1 hypothetical protein FQ087_08870 [Sporosarcina sp. ANT_H38]
MDLWVMIKERYALLSIFVIIIFVSLILLVAIWKTRFETPKSLIVIITIICAVMIVLSISALVIAVSFGYNS